MGLFNIQTFEMFEGDLPTKAQELVREWLEQHSQELQKMWDNQIITKPPPAMFLRRYNLHYVKHMGFQGDRM